MVPRFQARVEFDGRQRMIASILLADGSNPAGEFLDALATATGQRSILSSK
jgi:hypothetical protein